MTISYWWVNHKQTHAAEIDGGYIWSPQKKANGQTNATYLNLTQVMAGDVVFSYAGGKLMAIGIATSSHRIAQKPAEFGNSGSNWDSLGWLVPIEWQMLKQPIVPKQHLGAIGPLLPKVHSPIRMETGDGNQGCYLAAISIELGRLLQGLAGMPDREALDVAAERSADAAADVLQAEIESAPHLGPTEIEQLVRARRGQGRFRLNLLKVEKRCRLTHVELEQFLVASHIKPWAVCTNEERLDGHNGLLLAPHIDRLFDRGWITFSDTGELMTANDDARSVLAAWGVTDPEPCEGAFTKRQCAFLAYHRQEVFRNGFRLES
jgi:putative restriction endonuclease